jgi:hypothetical protein
MLKPEGASKRAGGLFAAWELCRLTELPRPRVAGPIAALGDIGRRQRLAALIAAYHSAAAAANQSRSDSDQPEEDRRQPVVLGWFRAADGPSIEVVVGGPSLIGPPVSSKLLALSYPPGARGERVSGDRAAGLLKEYPFWASISGVSDVLSAQEERAEGDELRPNLEDCLLGAWRTAFAWIVVAFPLSRADIRELTELESHRVREARAKSGSSQDHAVELERRQARHRELRQAESNGLWRIGVLTGGRTRDEALQIAALVASSADIGELPYVLRPGGLVASLDSGLDAIRAPHEEVGFTGSTEVLAALARPPSGEIPGIRLVLQPSFDVTREEDDSDSGECIRLGSILDRNRVEVGEMTVSRDTLNRHTFVCGATGSGKTKTVKRILEELHRIRIPWLVIEPTKAEYRAMGRTLGYDNVIVIRPGETDMLPAGLNPLEPEPGFPLQTHADLVRALFLAAFEADEPFPQILNAALTRCYEELGWDLVLGRARRAGVTPRIPTLSDLQRIGRAVVADIGYGTEVTQNVRGFIDVRIGSLRSGTPGKFFEGGHPLNMGLLLDKNVVLEIEGVGDDRDKAFLIGTVVMRVYEHLWLENKKRGGKEPTLQHVTVVEEAHRLLRFTTERGPAAHAVELFASLLAEVRAYGEGIIVAEQIPSKLIPDVIKNSALKVIHRLPAQDDREAVGATMNLTEEQSQYIVTLKPGDGAVFSDGMDQPMLVHVRAPQEPQEAEMVSELTERGEKVNDQAPLRSRFSPACGPTCQRAACSLSDMRLAQLELRDRNIVLWAELAVVAHIVGYRTPRPIGLLKMALDRLGKGPRHLQCVIAHAVDAAVASRAAALVEDYSPHRLVAHVGAVLLIEALGRGGSLHVGEPQWEAGPFKWNHVRRALRLWEDGGNSARHPDTERWTSELGMFVAGDTVQEQWRTINSWAEPRSGLRESLLFGTSDKPALETAVGARRKDRDWGSRLATAIDASLELSQPWAQNLLQPIGARGGGIPTVARGGR